MNISNRFKNLEKEYQNATEEKYIINLNKIQNIEKIIFLVRQNLKN